MAYVPSATSNRTPAQKDNRNSIYALLIGIIVLLSGYIIYDKTQDHKTETVLTETTKTLAAKEVDYKNLDSAKNILQAQFDVASHKIDTLTTNNVKLSGALSARSSELAKMKSNISSILTKKNASEKELKEAEQKLAELNTQIDSYVAEIAKLKAENQQLTTDKNQLTTEKDKLTTEKNQLSTDKKNLEDKVDIASTLTASHIAIVAIKMSGSKEKETETAKRANFFRLSFVIDENRVAPSGNKLLYVVVTGPDGKTSASNGTFKSRDGVDVEYTEKMEANYEQGKVLPVSFDWKPAVQFVPGDYKIEIYNNGFKIGETKKSLKKGGLFS
jgi:myosin heavy subunit